MNSLSSTDIEANIKLVIDASNDYYKDKVLFAQLSACQAILEAGLLHSPPSSLALKYNNLFGIKGSGTGLVIDGKLKRSVALPTKEFFHGSMHTLTLEFAVNASVEDSFAQHAALFNLNRYSKLKTARTFSEIAYFVRDCGYATDPHYSEKLLAIYNRYIVTRP